MKRVLLRGFQQFQNGSQRFQNSGMSAADPSGQRVDAPNPNV
ncbi:hypothetical protein ALP33_102261 [Pseudomonas amygdali pv. lachrymans]|uniref:Uncharacterized protein n=1 Tax=Pseudomonas amygdali pv. lachrymans TaxID=53707 RepID=A0AB37R2T6_PSEAV|nr:hypothetical protein ALQ79_102218 [Pseudomonas amygdali pv. lachrymans]RMP41987.1 hypothetical protein ALQ26_102609 [Pseudomonas amygdali pv. lachrymans]RMT04408.1 hypothetical protein ALP54_102140 [Pseudomonas amygdali pv. lachrymans]RMU16747.1 hypothetical protein ALP33_102261 [Pseudomonas amygdali pv. lachrymans]RMV49705.1 hypothetical protein ALP09_103477 [Pseudomonas amygdali pv. lachrymans]